MSLTASSSLRRPKASARIDDKEIFDELDVHHV